MQQIISSTTIFLSLLTSINAVSVRLELQLDSAPQETSWEVRGPLPRPTLIGGVTFDYYSDPSSQVIEVFDLEEGQYLFLLNDFENNGINNGSFKIIAELIEGPKVLAEGSGAFGSGQISEFTVPEDQPVQVEVSRDGGYFRGSLSSR